MKCGRPPEITDGKLRVPPEDEYDADHAVQYECDHGYTLLGDEEPADTVRCTSDGGSEGVWSSPPRCTSRFGSFQRVNLVLDTSYTLMTGEIRPRCNTYSDDTLQY